MGIGAETRDVVSRHARTARLGEVGPSRWHRRFPLEHEKSNEPARPRGVAVTSVEDGDGPAETFTTWMAARLNVSLAR